MKTIKEVTDMEPDEKDKIIEHLRAELNRHKEMLTSVFETKNRMQKKINAFGERLNRLHNENQALKATIRKLENPISRPARRRWKSVEANPAEAGWSVEQRASANQECA